MAHDAHAVVAPELPRITAEVAANKVQSTEGVAVVDVRDQEEFTQGHLPGALNLASAAFTADNAQVDALIKQLEDKSEVIVHCAKSQQRGPASAALLKARLEELGLAGGKQVVVMEGGFNRYGELFSGTEGLVEQGSGPSAPTDT